MVKIKLGDLCVPSSGQIKADAEELIDYFDISSIDNEIKKVTGFQTMSFGESPSRARKAVKKGSILVSTVRPNLNAVAMLEEDTPNISVASTGFCILDCKENVDNRFVFSFCKSKPFIDAMVSQATGASYPAVSDKIVRAALVPKYTYEEQCNISETLGKVSNVIDSRKAELSALDELIKARFVEMFGDPKANPFEWITSTVGELILSCEAGWSGNGKQRKKKDGEIAVLKVSAVTKGYFDSDECKVLDDQDIIKKYVYPQAGDLLFSRANTREMVGATAVITQDYPEHILSDKLWRVRFCDAANVWYMKYVLSSKSIRSIFSSVSNGTSGSMFNVSMGKFKSIRIPLPPIELQQQFAAFVAQVDKSKAAVQKALDETQLLFDSLMQEYFG